MTKQSNGEPKFRTKVFACVSDRCPENPLAQIASKQYDYSAPAEFNEPKCNWCGSSMKYYPPCKCGAVLEFKTEDKKNRTPVCGHCAKPTQECACAA